MSYKFLFLVSSSILHFAEEHFSRYSAEQRFYQTLETIESIRIRSPESYVCLFECSHAPIPVDYKKELEERTDLFLEFHSEAGIETLYSNFEQNQHLITFGKSLLETRGMLNCLYLMREKQIFTDVNRVFKLTGRYTLNEFFDIRDYESKFLENHYVIKAYSYLDKEKQAPKVDDLENIYAYLYQAEGMMVTGMWSFDRLLFNDTVIALERSFTYLEKMIQYTTGTDIEHALYRFLDKSKIIRVPNLGLNVNKGMEGAIYSI